MTAGPRSVEPAASPARGTWLQALARAVRMFLPALPSVALTGGAVVLCAISIPEIDLSRMNDLGLVSVLPPPFFVGLALLTISFCISLRGLPRTKPLVFANVVVLILVVYGLPPLVEHEARLAAAWRHTGVIENILRTGEVDPRIDAYFDWPGFFIAGSFLTKAAGLKSAVPLLAWAPLFFNLLFLAPMLLVLRAATPDDRLVWLAVWLFYSANWVGQDYFSPQALAYFFYLVVLAVLLRWFAAPAVGSRNRLVLERRWAPRRVVARLARSVPTASRVVAPDVTPMQRLGLMALAIAVVAVTVASHQLTPFAMLLSIGALVASNRTPARGVPVITAVLIGTWITFMATEYLKGHFDILTSNLGHLEANVQAGVATRLAGSSDHQIVAQGRLLFAASVWGLALLGVIRSIRNRQLYVGHLVLAMAPFGLAALQPYGGEVLFRVFLFVLPFMALFAAALFIPEPRAAFGWVKTFVLAVVLSAILGGFLLARYGNERFEHFSRDDVRAVRELYRLAPKGSTLVAGSRNLPWKFEGYDQFTYRIVTDTERWNETDPPGDHSRRVAREVALLMQRSGPRRAFLIITRSQKAYVDALGYGRPGALARFESAVEGSRQFKQVYANPDAAIFVIAPRREETP